MKKFDCIVLGGGASGSVCAIALAKKGLSVAVVDKFAFPAKKLLVTGNGKCNITNKNLSSEFYNTNLDMFFAKFGYNECKEFYKSIGIEIYSDAEGRCYPITNSAQSVVKAIENQFDKLNIAFYGNSTVQEVLNTGTCYQVELNEQTLQSKNIVFASGGNTSFDILKNEKLEKYSPSLVALKTLENTKTLDGVRMSNVLVKLHVDGKQYLQFGEVLFKDHGVSGICVFNLSCHLARKHNYSEKMEIDFLPNISLEKTLELIETHASMFALTKDILTGILPEKVASVVFTRLGIKTGTLANKLTKSQVRSIANLIHNFSLTICDHYDNNQVYSGGVALNSLTPFLMSKQNNGLYFCGEILNVDGECGGYNLQWAFTSAMVVADDIGK